jgi:hypothetical protein
MADSKRDRSDVPPALRKKHGAHPTSNTGSNRRIKLRHSQRGVVQRDAAQKWAQWFLWYLLLPVVYIHLVSVLNFGPAPLPVSAQSLRLEPKLFQAAAPATQQAARTKIAEGEYSIIEEANEGAVGPLGEEIYDFHETWTLWRVAKGQYEVEGVRRFEFPRDWFHADRFLVQLSRDRTVIRMTEFGKLRWRPDSGPLSCEFLPTELHCSSGGKDPKNRIEIHTAVQKPYGLLWPVSAFSLSGITREAERDPSVQTQVQLVSIQQPSADNPVSVLVFGGYLQYLGEESIQLAGQNWPAHKFLLKVALHPKFLIWTSQDGLLLAVAVEHSHPNWPQEGMRLMHFQKWTDF